LEQVSKIIKHNVCETNFISLCNLVGHLPLFTKHPKNQTITLKNRSTRYSLSCNAIGASSYHWEKQNDNIPTNVIGMNTNTLTFVKLHPSNAGFYRCVARNNSGSSYSYYAKLIINDGKLIFS